MNNFKFLPLALLLGLSSQIFSMNKLLLQKLSALQKVAPTSVRAVHSNADKWTRYSITNMKNEFSSIEIIESPTLTASRGNPIYFRAIISSRYPQGAERVKHDLDPQPCNLQKRYHAKHPHFRLKGIRHTDDVINVAIDINTSLCSVERIFKAETLTATHDASLIYEIYGADVVDKADLKPQKTTKS